MHTVRTILFSDDCVSMLAFDKSSNIATARIAASYIRRIAHPSINVKKSLEMDDLQDVA